MAIEYTFVLDSTKGTSALAEVLVENLPLVLDERSVPDTVVGDGIVCVSSPQSELGRELVEETFGIDSKIKLVCWLDKFDRHSMGMSILVEISTFFLTTCSCDMVLLSNGERALLLRKSGSILVDCRDEYWRHTWNVAFAHHGILVAEQALPSL